MPVAHAKTSSQSNGAAETVEIEEVEISEAAEIPEE
jgi:hypothetical protein